ncbi:ABC transporter permease [Nocardia farcinica]|uniref:ABC transporter permease n=1 Tax=Nocardia farcinica TaxID=37329 RepID=UPI001894037E|nr:ABC transporter permease [Nocardia farcinica]MBF6235030.1 ABC transporter permease [Nocardia farcinica]
MTATRAAGATGAEPLLRFALHQERFTLPWWLAGTGALLAFQSVGSQNFYDTPAKLAQLRTTMGGNAAAVAMGGPTRLLDSIGGEVLFEIFAYLGMVVALMSMFLVGRHTRSDEEAGRAELLRSAILGRRAPVTAALGLASIANAVGALVVFAAAAGTGLPLTGSLLTGLAVGGIGLTFAAATAVAAQIVESPRTVYGVITLLLASAYVLRAVGDVGNGAAAWFSPLGWGQRTYPFVADRWWPLLLFVLAVATLTAVAYALLERRDFGAGLVPARRGRAEATRWLAGPLALAWRLQRGALTAWIMGVLLLGAAYGSFAQSIEEFLTDNPVIADYLPGGVERAVDSYLALTLGITALLAAAYGITAALRARSEETAGRAEPILAAPVSRTAWLGTHLSVALTGAALVAVAGGLGSGVAHGLMIGDLGQVSRLATAALAYVPAVWTVAAVAVLGFGRWPRSAAVVAWAFFAYCVVAALFADAFDLPGWFDEASPLRHSPQAPLESASATTMLVTLVIAAALIGAGAAAFRRRDAGY